MPVSHGRDAILHSARELFARFGYSHTSLRMVAKAAGCDVALIAYHFGNKQQLFTAAIDPDGLTAHVRELLATIPLEHIGQSLITHLVHSWSTPAGAQVLGGIRSLLDTSTQQAIPLGMTIWAPLKERLETEGISHAQERVEAAMSIIIGAATLRHFAGNSALSMLGTHQFINLYAPILQRCLTGNWPEN